MQDSLTEVEIPSLQLTDLAAAFSVIILLADLCMESSFSLQKMSNITNYLNQNDLGPGLAELTMSRARKHYLSNKCMGSDKVT